MQISAIFKSKRGDALVLTMFLVIMFVFMTIFLVDVGFGYLGRAQMQNINDACAIAGASAGAYAYVSRTVDQSPHAIVIPDVAKSVTMEVFNRNSKYLLSRFKIDSPVINPSGEIIDGKAMSTNEQYYSGNYTVKLNGRYQTLLVGNNNIFGLNIPFLNYRTEARVHVHPQYVNE